MSSPGRDAKNQSRVGILRRERETQIYYLEQIEGTGAPQRIPLQKPEMFIGHTDDCLVRIPSQKNSQRHACLMRRGMEYVIQDIESHDGVFLNGVKIHSAVLRDGDIIQITDAVFVFREG